MSNARDYADDALRLDHGTSPADIREFVESRAEEPIHLNGITVWSFNNHEVDMPALRNSVGSFARNRYLIPFQVPAVWAYIYDILPQEMSQLEVLAYKSSERRYVPYPNYSRQSNPPANERTRERVLRSFMEEYDGSV